jgi:histidine triad (HIT) family protein
LIDIGSSASTSMDNCIFCKIAKGEIPAKKVYEDDEIVAFNDINPQAPVHFMLVPKKHIASLADATSEDAGVVGRMMVMSGKLAREQGSPDGYRTVVNTGRVGRQDVMHLHIHVIGGPEPLGRMLPKA